MYTAGYDFVEEGLMISGRERSERDNTCSFYITSLWGDVELISWPVRG